MKAAEFIKCTQANDNDAAVFAGTHVPVRFLFDYLADDQTLETFLDQFPAVSREQAHAALGISRDLLLNHSN